MSPPLMDDRARRLILGAEIAGLIHDLGKLRPEFAEEKLEGLGSSERKRRFDKPSADARQGEAHGAILEPKRAYPPAGEDEWLQQLLVHPEWAASLQVPEDWIYPGTPQAQGLGEPLRQHHARQLADHEATLLGDVFTFGADGRDSALDKGSGGIPAGKQRLDAAHIADSFGNEETRYSEAKLRELWQAASGVVREILLVPGATRNLEKTRNRFLAAIEPIFRQALGETRRPTNDVTLWHHSYATASLFKAAVAEGVLRHDFRHLLDHNGLVNPATIGRIRFRLLGIRWDWAALTQGILQPVALTALEGQRCEAVENLRRRLEESTPVGNLVYQDDGGVVVAVPGFFFPDSEEAPAEKRFLQYLLEPLQAGILSDLAPLGAGVPVRLAWTEPRLYLTDYPEVMSAAWHEASGERQRLLQVGEQEFRALWERQTGLAEQVQICPQCGLRPGKARELGLTESTLRGGDERVPHSFCDHCRSMVDGKSREQRQRQAKDLFGFVPRDFELQRIREERDRTNARVVMLSIQVLPGYLASGAGLLTQLARPMAAMEADIRGKLDSPLALGEFFQSMLTRLETGPLVDETTEKQARQLIGDNYWMRPGDGRFEGGQGDTARRLVDEFFLREPIPHDLGLYRHDGDRLALFAQRKHPSPGRLARLWDDLRNLWRQILWDIAGDTEQWLLPLSLDATGFRVIVAARDARAALQRIDHQIDATLGKVRAGIDVHVSVLAFREKFPLYVALDALQRLESRAGGIGHQDWTLKSRYQDGERRELNWSTPRGEVKWRVNMATGDPERPDIWYPHAVCVSRPEGPGRLVRLDELQPGEIVRLRPSTFDFAVLEGTTRRYSLRYDRETGARPHYILGEAGRPPYPLEQMTDLLAMAGQIGWNPSQSKGVLGRLIECYERWVRDVPGALQAQGRAAWLEHARSLFRRYPSKDPALQERLPELLADGTLFDAFEWAEFIEKGAHSFVNPEENSTKAREIP